MSLTGQSKRGTNQWQQCIMSQRHHWCWTCFYWPEAHYAVHTGWARLESSRKGPKTTSARCFCAISLSVCLPLCLSTSCLPASLSACLSASTPYLLQAYLCTACLSTACLPVCLPACLSTCLSVCLPVYPSFCLPVYLSVCLPV